MVSLESTVDTGHEDLIHDAQLDYYGTRLATCSSDRGKTARAKWKSSGLNAATLTQA